MKRLYVFDESKSNASIFGVGTYVQTLISCIENSEIKVTVIKLFSDFKNVQIYMENSIQYIHIPHLVPITANRKNYYRSVFFIIAPFISRQNENIFHYNYLTCYPLAKLLKEQFPLSKNLLTVHYRELSTSENIDFEKKLVNDCCERVIVLANHSSLSLQNEYCIPFEKIKIISNGLYDYFPIVKKNSNAVLRKYFGIGDSEVVILYVGRFDQNKNPYLLMKSFLKLVQQNNSCHLIFAGEGDYCGLYSCIDHSWGKVTLTGFLSKDKLHLLYKIADIGVITSKYEEFGFVAVEMMMHKLPVIANKTSGLTEIVQEGITGKLVDLYSNKEEADSILLLKDAICELIDNEYLRLTYGKNGRDRFLKYYNEELFKERMLNLYNELFE